MNGLLFLIPITICLGLVGLGAFIWNLRNGQYEDLAGAAERILIETPELRRGSSREPHVRTAPPRASEDEAQWSQI